MIENEQLNNTFELYFMNILHDLIFISTGVDHSRIQKRQQIPRSSSRYSNSILNTSSFDYYDNIKPSYHNIFDSSKIKVISPDIQIRYVNNPDQNSIVAIISLIFNIQYLSDNSVEAIEFYTFQITKYKEKYYSRTHTYKDVIDIDNKHNGHYDEKIKFNFEITHMHSHRFRDPNISYFTNFKGVKYGETHTSNEPVYEREMYTSSKKT